MNEKSKSIINARLASWYKKKSNHRSNCLLSTVGCRWWVPIVRLPIDPNAIRNINKTQIAAQTTAMQNKCRPGNMELNYNNCWLLLCASICIATFLCSGSGGEPLIAIALLNGRLQCNRSYKHCVDANPNNLFSFQCANK